MLGIFNSYWKNKKGVFGRIFIVNVSYYLTENKKKYKMNYHYLLTLLHTF